MRTYRDTLGDRALSKSATAAATILPGGYIDDARASATPDVAQRTEAALAGERPAPSLTLGLLPARAGDVGGVVGHVCICISCELYVYLVRLYFSYDP
jgi:hypothetical protein